MWTVALQRRRLNSTEPEDKEFVFRTWADFQFLIVALNRLRRAARLAARLPALTSSVGVALSDFDADLPWLKTLRNIAEHIDDYAIERGRNRNIDRRALEVSTTDGETWTWLDCEVNVKQAFEASARLFEAIKTCGKLLV
jgi:hypothetical protein